jgi:dTDP-4-dehydrorhamnose 3,5-epimerase
MKFKDTAIDGAFLVDLCRVEDHRGFFARAWSADESAVMGLPAAITDVNISLNTRRGTIRGMHYQLAPHAEAKFVRCVSGAFYDVIIDLRPDSPTFLKWAGFEIHASTYQALFVPAGCAHGIQTLADDTGMLYMTTGGYHPVSERGIRWDDAFFSIVWPVMDAPVLSKKDLSWPGFDPGEIQQAM